MIVVGLIATKAEAEELNFITKVAMVATWYKDLKKVD